MKNKDITSEITDLGLEASELDWIIVKKIGKLKAQEKIDKKDIDELRILHRAYKIAVGIMNILMKYEEDMKND